jgi:hypothetical protein
MNPRRAAFFAPFRWLVDAVDVGRHQPQVVIGAIVTAAAIGLLPSLPGQVMGLAGSPPGMGLMVASQLLALAFALLVMPVLRAGVYRILDGAERGEPVRMNQIFDGFSDGSYARIVGLTAMAMLLFFVLMLVMLLVMAIVVGVDAAQGLQAWAERFAALQSEAGVGKPIPPAQIEALGVPPGLGAIFGVLFAFLPLWLFVALGSAWGLVSVALRGTAPVEALVGGLRAAMVNALPLLALVVALALPLLLLTMLVGLVLGALVALVSAISPAIGGALALLAFLAIGVVIAAISYGFTLNGWRAACDSPDATRSDTPPTAPLAGFEA